MGTSGSLQVYVVTRLLLAVPMLLILLTFVFFLLHVAPGDPVLAIAPPGAPESTIQRLRADLGLDRPLWQQYVDYMVGFVTLDLGESLIRRGVPVTQIVKETFPATLELTLGSMIVSLSVGLFFGAVAGARRGTAWDSIGRLFGILVYSVPIFWLGLMAILVFSVMPHQAGAWWALPSDGRGPLPYWQWTGNEGQAAEITGLYVLDALVAADWPVLKDNLEHLILPSLTLGLVNAGIFIRLTRVNMLQTMQADYVEAARARGAPERVVVFRHAFKNALIPVITIVGLTFALLLGGAVLTENVFNWPGVARELTRAIGLRDYAVVQGIVAFLAVLVVAVSLVIDILNAYVDPRIRY